MSKNKKENKQTGIEVQAVGLDGNIFAIIGRVGQAMCNAGLPKEAKQMVEETRKTHSYDDALNVIQEFVRLT